MEDIQIHEKIDNVHNNRKRNQISLKQFHFLDPSLGEVNDILLDFKKYSDNLSQRTVEEKREGVSI